MTMNEFFIALAQISGLLFIITSMLAMGMSLSMAQILQPLKNARLVILALLANFVLVPLIWGVLKRLHGLPMFGAPTVAQLEDPSYRPGIVGMKKVDDSHGPAV